MKRIMYASLATLVFAGCSEPTAPSKALDVTSPVYARKTGGGGAGGGPTTVVIDDNFSFEPGAAATASSFGTELQAGAVGEASDPAVATSPSGQRFLGRFQETRTQLVLTTPAGHSKYSLAFDLYTIGSWDGKGKQAQNGVFEANVVQIGYRCGTSATITPLFSTTFSNQLTVQQDYPRALGLGGNKAGTGSFAQDALGYRGHPELSNTPPFRSFADVSYRLTFAGANPCGTNAMSFVWDTSNPTQQNLNDESWGIDNVNLKMGS
ncbi:MAG: hypothetical protein ABI681_01555 [Gemmatimonadales bacterium]